VRYCFLLHTLQRSTVWEKDPAVNSSGMFALPVPARSFWLTINATKNPTVAFCVIAPEEKQGLAREAQSPSPRVLLYFSGKPSLAPLESLGAH
jgi:hypothetical protein